jgi:hypothetical protein
LLSWLFLLFPSMFFLDLLFSFSPVVSISFFMKLQKQKNLIWKPLPIINDQTLSDFHEIRKRVIKQNFVEKE